MTLQEAINSKKSFSRPVWNGEWVQCKESGCFLGRATPGIRYFYSGYKGPLILSERDVFADDYIIQEENKYED